MILVTCANGNAGKRITARLVKAGLKVRAMDINAGVEKLKETLGVEETVIGDGNNPEDMKKAMEGIEQVLYLPPLFVHYETNMAKIAVDTAVRAGVKQFVMMSVAHPNMSTLLQHTAKRKAEEYLVYAGLKEQLNYTILQPMHYCHNFDVEMVEKSGIYTCFYCKDTRLSLVDADDVGDAAAKVLSEPERHRNASYELCGPDYLSSAEQMAIYNRVSGKQAAVKEMDIEDFIKMIHVEDTYSQDCLRQLSFTYGKYGIAGNPNVLRWLLEREPISFEGYIRKSLML